MSYPDTIGAQLQHLQAREVFKVGNVANFVVKQKKFLHLSQLLQTLHLPQNVKRHVELPVDQSNKEAHQNELHSYSRMKTTTQWTTPQKPHVSV